MERIGRFAVEPVFHYDDGLGLHLVLACRVGALVLDDLGPPCFSHSWRSARNLGFRSSGWSSRSGSQSGNQVFDEYQQTQYDRIAEIKTEIRDTYDRFRDFKNDAKRKAEQEEFDTFMNSSRPTQAE